MDSKMVGEGSQSMAAFVDSQGNLLDGGKNYKLHLPPNIPVANFWSVILYDNQTRSMLRNDQQWPAVSSQTKGLLVNPDSSVDVYFGPKPPPGKENNWCKPSPAKVGTLLCASTAHWSHGSTRRGGRERSSYYPDFGTW